MIKINKNELSENNETESENTKEPDDSNNSEESEELIIEKTKPKKKKRKLNEKKTPKKKRKLSKYNIFMSKEMKRLKKNGIASDKLFSTAVRNWKKSKD